MRFLKQWRKQADQSGFGEKASEEGDMKSVDTEDFCTFYCKGEQRNEATVRGDVVSKEKFCFFFF